MTNYNEQLEALQKKLAFTRKELEQQRAENAELHKQLSEYLDQYDYVQAVKDDVRAWIDEHIDFDDWDDWYDLRDHVYDECWCADAVTGNASGSYFCNAWKAESCLCHNMDLLEEAADAFDGDLGEWVERGAEYCDVSIRCYLLSSAVADVISELQDEIDLEQDEIESDDE